MGKSGILEGLPCREGLADISFESPLFMRVKAVGIYRLYLSLLLNALMVLLDAFDTQLEV